MKDGGYRASLAPLLPSALHVERRTHHGSAAATNWSTSRPHGPISKITICGWSTSWLLARIAVLAARGLIKRNNLNKYPMDRM
jgi:hypothetical protein